MITGSTGEHSRRPAVTTTSNVAQSPDSGRAADGRIGNGGPARRGHLMWVADDLPGTPDDRVTSTPTKG